jgi:hypothetical protein
MCEAIAKMTRVYSYYDERERDDDSPRGTWVTETTNYSSGDVSDDRGTRKKKTKLTKGRRSTYRALFLMYEGRLKSSWTHYSESELCGGAVTVSFFFFEVPPLASGALLTTLGNMLQTVCRKLQEDSGTGVFLALELPFHGWKSLEIAWGEFWTPWA